MEKTSGQEETNKKAQTPIKPPKKSSKENFSDGISVNQLSDLLDLKLNSLKTSISSLESQISGLDNSMNSKISEVTKNCNSQIKSLKVGINEDIQRIDSRMNSLARDIEDLQLQGGDFSGPSDSSKNAKRILELETDILDLKSF